MPAAPAPADTFAAAMAGLGRHVGGFNDVSHIAVAVSGGSDSLALALLAAPWCRARGVTLTALIVDHGLRPESGAEADRVAASLRERGMAAEILRWSGPKPETAIQAAARDARYALMAAWCRDHGIAHLLVGHTADDQAETVLMRLQRASGPDGLAGMSAVRRLEHVQVLRPLLGMRRQALQAFLRGRGEAWISDPANRDYRFARTRARAAIRAGHFDVTALCDAARRYGQVRVVAEAAAARFAADHVDLAPAGYMTIDAAALGAAPEDTACRVLARALAAVGGLRHPPRRHAVEALVADVRAGAGRGRTLGGCRVATLGDRLLVCREYRNLPDALALAADMDLRWDGRIRLRTTATCVPDVHVVAAGQGRWSDAGRDRPDYRAWRRLPAQVRATVPVLADSTGVFSAPLLAYNNGDVGADGDVGVGGVSMRFAPRRDWDFAGFCIA